MFLAPYMVALRLCSVNPNPSFWGWVRDTASTHGTYRKLMVSRSWWPKDATRRAASDVNAYRKYRTANMVEIHRRGGVVVVGNRTVRTNVRCTYRASASNAAGLDAPVKYRRMPLSASKKTVAVERGNFNWTVLGNWSPR